MWLPNAQADFVSPERIENVYLQHPLVKQIFIHGSTFHAYLIAIAVVDVDKLRADIEKSNKKFGNFSTISKLSMMEYLCDQNVRRYFLIKLREFGSSKGLSGIEQIRNIHLLEEEFTIEAGLLTPTLKIIRIKIER
ncbi:hypothetical protein WUBG_08916 [Wuchereria bancrofti]|uniref:AMP-binding enzyme C-terminal domain-containing protein n=1 Tax=Wuchereria bancrofti TaxID=6293 RepID=J9EDB9_WUCBA|nr:hypothetical protein WUBG_08916 [Wuchereria bancrofti]